MTKFVIDKAPKKIWGLNQMKISETFTGIPTAEYYKNKKENQFIHLMLDAGYSTCHIYFLIFDFPLQKVLNKNIHNSFQLVKHYRQSHNIAIDNDITMFHDIDWREIIDWVNKEETMKIQVISKNMNGFQNIKFLPTKKSK